MQALNQKGFVTKSPPTESSASECRYNWFPLFSHCTKSSVSDDRGLIEMFEQNIDYFKSKPVNIPKITVMVDHGYNPEYLTKELQKIYPQIMTKIKFKLTPKP